jgi:hypothetical protein
MKLDRHTNLNGTLFGAQVAVAFQISPPRQMCSENDTPTIIPPMFGQCQKGRWCMFSSLLIYRYHLASSTLTESRENVGPD